MQLRKGKGKIGQVLQSINILSLLALGAVTILISYQWTTRTIYMEVEQELKNAARSANILLDTAYPGDYTLVGDNALRLYKGESDITGDFTIIDMLKDDTEWEIPCFIRTRVS